MGRSGGKFINNPTRSQLADSDINLIVAGNRSGIVMVEGGGNFVAESEMIDAIFHGYEAIQTLLDVQEEMKREVGRPKRDILEETRDEALQEKVADIGTSLLQNVITIADKKMRQQKRKEAVDSVLDSLSEAYQERESDIKEAVHTLEKKLIRKMILEEGRRIDGRAFSEVRPIECVVGLLPRVHGSALFTRGETQAMVLTTLGTEMDEQRIESIYGNHFRSFILHYNFPPYSVGEARRLSGPGRR